MTDADIEALVAQRSCFGEAFPSEDRTETVVFQSFYEKGFGLPSRAFFQGLLHYYGVGGNIATFIHLCEGFLGIAPHFNLWRALYHLRAYPNKDTLDVVGGAAFSLCQGGKYPEASLKDNNKLWVEEWFVVANPAPGLPPRTGLTPVLNARWEEKPTNEEMVKVELLLAKLQKLKAKKLTGVVVALSFTKRLTPANPGVGPPRNHKVSGSKADRRVTLIVSGEVRDKGCLKAYCLKRPTTNEKNVSFWCSAPLLEGQQGKAVDPPTGLALPAADVGSFSSDSSIGSESDNVVEVSGLAAGTGSTTKKPCPTRKVAASKAQRGGVTLRGRSSTPPGASRVGTEAAAEKAGLTTPKPDEEDQGEERGRPTRFRFCVNESNCRRVLLSGAKRKAEESTSEAVSAKVAKGEASPSERPQARPPLIEGAAVGARGELAASEPPQGDNVVPLEVTLGDCAKGGVVEDPTDPNAGSRAIAPVLVAA
ncbi:putative gypsy-type retrotransposon RIRE2 protein [Panicum miliaceum]|uniref:Gypsy-type retrotransposon RIRE2 protein n=1 Tax=Panicum miliaceum TaxID=4540 RepID=A0A3L6RHW7_PANMI|nr:putative gypsy-type retrotransposon RIRE2 protein [Panicum miliaceum]